MSNLYRKYRPQLFSEVYGQRHIKQTIENELKLEKTSHAYLFCGPRGTGKTTMARLLAKSLNCENREKGKSEPCNKCDSCKEVMKSNTIDVIEIDAASNTGVDNVRDNIINSARFAPTKSTYKIFIIDEVHMLSTSAFNALLKILEEPPEHIVFILATTEIHKIIPTIISRCQRFDFQKIKYEDLYKKLEKIVKKEKIQVDGDVLDIIIGKSDGCVRDAESLLGQVLSLDEKHITLKHASLVFPITNYSLVCEFVDNMIDQDVLKLITHVNELVDNGLSVEQFTEDLIEYLRKILLFTIHQSFDRFGLELQDTVKKSIKFHSMQLDIQFLVKMIEYFLRASKDLKNAQIIQLPLELAIVELLEFENKTVGSSVQTTQANVPKNTQDVTPINQKMPPKTHVVVKDEETQEAVSVPETTAVKSSENLSSSSEHVTESGLQPDVSESTTQEDAISERKESPDAIDAEQIPESAFDNNSPSEINTSISLDEIQKQWRSVQHNLKDKNYSLSILLSSGKPCGYNNGTIEIGFKHQFMIDKVNTGDNKRTLELAFKEILGGDYLCVVKKDDGIEPPAKKTSISMEELHQRNLEDRLSQQAKDSEEKNVQKVEVHDKEAINDVLDILGGNVVS